MQTVTNYYISALALSDVVLALFCIPFQFRAALMQRWDLPEFMCQFCPFMQTLSVGLQQMLWCMIKYGFFTLFTIEKRELKATYEIGQA